MTGTTLSQALKEAYASAPANVVIYHTMELRHPAFTAPIRVVRDYAPLTATLEATAPADPATGTITGTSAGTDTDGDTLTYTLAGGPALEYKATFAAGTFTTGTAITEAAVRENSGGGVCFGRGLLDASKNPTAAEPLDITIQFPIVAV